MSSERPTVRPVTLARLVELAHVCRERPQTTDEIRAALDVTHRRARETILESMRIELVSEINGELDSHNDGDEDEPSYETTDVGQHFLEHVENEEWTDVSQLLAEHSPHYDGFLEVLEAEAPATLEEVLDALEARHADSEYTYNQTGVEVVGDWAERLGVVQRNAFTGSYYRVERDDVPEDFPTAFLTTFDEREERAGLNLKQRYLSIPELREHVCERLRCRRSAFDEALVALVDQNVGKVELSGAPLDTGAKDAKLGIKSMELADDDGLVSTSQSTERVMAGVEHHGKQYYYVAIHDTDLDFAREVAR